MCDTASLFCLAQVINPTISPTCVYVLPNYSYTMAYANPDSVAGWVFSDLPFALRMAPSGCAYSMSAFANVYTMIDDLPVSWAGIGFQPGNQFIVQGGYGVSVAAHE